MKGWAIYLLIILAISASLCCYRQKYNRHPNDLEKYKAGLNGIKNSLSPVTRITIWPEYNNKETVSIMIGYLLAPYKGYLGGNMDTVLYILPKNLAADNQSIVALKKMNIIWQNSAYGISYILARKQKS